MSGPDSEMRDATGDFDLTVKDAQSRLLASPPRRAVEEVPMTTSLGRICAEDLWPHWPLPSWDLSSMDGYALGSSDWGDRAGGAAGAAGVSSPACSNYRIVGESSAGTPYSGKVGAGQCVRISTGAVVPDDCDQVLPQEEAHLEQGPSGAAIEVDPQALPQLAPGRFVRAAGQELPQSQRIVRAGERLELGHLSLLAATGYEKLQVYAKPRVAIVSTGDELIDIGTTPTRGQTVATNALMLRLQCEQAGATVLCEYKAADTREQTIKTFERCAEADLILSCGGISVGPHDHVLPSLDALGWNRLFRKVKLQPGRPTTAGRWGSAYVLALPGNPASSYVTFELFVRPLIQAMLGRPRAQWWRPERSVCLESMPVSDPKRDHYVRARVSGERATPLSIQNSGALASLCGHNALVRIPKGSHDISKTRYRALLLLSTNTETATEAATNTPDT